MRATGGVGRFTVPESETEPELNAACSEENLNAVDEGSASSNLTGKQIIDEFVASLVSLIKRVDPEMKSVAMHDDGILFR